MVERIKSDSSKLVEIAEKILTRTTQDVDEPVEFISTGCTTLNLAASQKGRSGGWARGRIINVVGKGSAGKTLTALEFFAYCHYYLKQVKSKIFPKVRKLDLRYNNTEGVMDFPLQKMYGEGFIKGVDWYQERRVEKWGRNIIKRIKALKKGEALIEVVDSWDTFCSTDDDIEFDSAIEKDTKLDGSFDLNIQKFTTRKLMPKLCEVMQGKDATIMLLSQMKHKIGVTKFEKQYYRKGGAALDFYTHQCAWEYHVKYLDHDIKGIKKVYGSKTRIVFERNKVAPPMESAVVTIIRNYGFDDVRSMLDYLYGPDKVNVEWDGEVVKRTELIEILETKPELQEEVKDAVINKWKQIEKLNDIKKGRRKYANFDDS